MIVFVDMIHYKEELDIRTMFKQLQNPYSYYSQLQFSYNNSKHFTTVSSDKNLCTNSKLQEIARIATYIGGEYINVHGTIHSNYHNSNVLTDSNGVPLLVKDTYIKISFWNSPQTFMHILMIPPIVTINSPTTHVIITPSLECDYIMMPVIEPIIINAFTNTDVPTMRQRREPLSIIYPTNPPLIPLQMISSQHTAQSRAVSPPSRAVSPPRAVSPKLITTSKKRSKKNKSHRKK